MIRMPIGTKLYDIRKIPGYEGYNSFCDGTIFCPRDMKIIGCGTKYEKCVEMTNEDKKLQSPPLFIKK